MNLSALFFLRSGRPVVCAFFFCVLTVAGVLHMVKLHFTVAMLADSPREYLLQAAAGGCFGIMFAEALFAYPFAWLTDLRRRIIPGPALAVAIPVVFLAVIHQTRYFLNDGPATVAMAGAVLAWGFLGRRNEVQGIEIPESFLTLIEAGKMDGGFAAGIVKSLRAMDRYNPRLFNALAAIHRKAGNASKAVYAARVAELLRDEAQ